MLAEEPGLSSFLVLKQNGVSTPSAEGIPGLYPNARELHRCLGGARVQPATLGVRSERDQRATDVEGDHEAGGRCEAARVRVFSGTPSLLGKAQVRGRNRLPGAAGSERRT